MKYDVAFHPINIACFSFAKIMLHTNNILNLFEQFFRRFFHGMISQKILDIMPDTVYLRKNYLIYPIQGRYPESFPIINS